MQQEMYFLLLDHYKYNIFWRCVQYPYKLILSRFLSRDEVDYRKVLMMVYVFVYTLETPHTGYTSVATAI